MQKQNPVIKNYIWEPKHRIIESGENNYKNKLLKFPDIINPKRKVRL